MLSFRKLVAEDSLQYRSIRLQSLQQYPDNYGASYETEAESEKLRFQTFIESPVSGKFMFGAFDGKNLIGLCGFIQEEQIKSNHRGLIVQMYVHDDYQRIGIGSSLLKLTIDEIKATIPSIKQISLGVIADNHSAYNIYKRAGFVEYGYLERYYLLGDRYLDHRFMVLYI